MTETRNVVTNDGKPVYISDDSEATQEVAQELRAEWGGDIEVWQNVTYEVTEND